MSPTIGVVIALLLVLVAGTYFALSTSAATAATAAQQAQQQAVQAQQDLQKAQQAYQTAQSQQQSDQAAAAAAAQQLADAQAAAQAAAQLAAQQAAQEAAKQAAAQAAAAAAAAAQKAAQAAAVPYSCAFQNPGDGHLYAVNFGGGSNATTQAYVSNPNSSNCLGLNAGGTGCPNKNCFIWQNQIPPGLLPQPGPDIQQIEYNATCTIL